jgi:hypothetical protein
VILRLDWQGIDTVTRPYFFSALLVPPSGPPLTEAVVWQPTEYPATCWSPGEWVGDSIALPLPDNPPPGDWWISLAVLDDASHAYRPVALAGGADAQIGLGPVGVP